MVASDAMNYVDRLRQKMDANPGRWALHYTRPGPTGRLIYDPHLVELFPQTTNEDNTMQENKRTTASLAGLDARLEAVEQSLGDIKHLRDELYGMVEDEARIRREDGRTMTEQLSRLDANAVKLASVVGSISNQVGQHHRELEELKGDEGASKNKLVVTHGRPGLVPDPDIPIIELDIDGVHRDQYGVEYLTLPQIIRNPHANPPSEGAMNVSSSHWYKMQREGLAPLPTKCGRFAYWPKDEIYKIRREQLVAAGLDLEHLAALGSPED